MQNKKPLVLSILGLAIVFSLSFLGCKKSTHLQSGYTVTTAIHNTLSDTVILVHGGKVYTEDGKDTLMFSTDSIKILPDSTFSNSYFVCTGNCPLVYIDPIVPGVIKMIVGNKEKIDTACGFSISRESNKVFDCTKDAKNYYNNQFWQETKDSRNNVVFREYNIDSKDLAEMIPSVTTDAKLETK